MRRSLAFGLVVVLTWAAAGMATRAAAEPGLLLVAHGAPSPEWNRPVLDFGRRVAATVEKRGSFKAVRTAMLESVEPSIPTAVAELEAAGCDRIVAVPLFIAPSSHTLFDVPAVLGIHWSPSTASLLAGEGAKVARPRVPVVLTGALAEGDVLCRYALDEVRKLSKSPEDEAIVVLAHGDPDHQPPVDRLLRRVTTYCCGAAGVRYGDWACIGVGQEYRAKAVPAIANAKKHKKRVLVVGLYLSTTASRIRRRAMAAVSNPHNPAPDAPDDRVVLSDASVIDHPALLDWALTSAYAACDAAARKE